MSRWLWWSWWLGALGAPLGPSLGLGPTHAGRVWLGVIALAALLLGAVTPVRRPAPSLGLAVALGALLVSEAWRLAPLVGQVPWLYVWGAWWDTAGWWWVLGLASLTVQRHAPALPRWWPGLLAGLLTAQWLAWTLASAGLTRWRWSMTPTGLWSGDGVWAACAVMALPILWAWRRWAILPALAGLLCAGTSSAWLAGALGWLTARRRLPWQWGLVLGGLVAGLLATEVTWRACVLARVHTWHAVARTIAATPSGIGWGMGAERAWLAHTRARVLPHPASEWLALPLRYGWWTLALWLWASVWVWRQPRTPGVQALRVAWWLAAWQTSLSLPAVGGLVWLIWCAERKGVSHVQEIPSPGPACAGPHPAT